MRGQSYCGEGSVGAKLARETGASISERPRRLHRGQALLPHSGAMRHFPSLATMITPGICV
ncbi:hypothetical protein DZG01_24650 [Pseudomonas fluorescens]|nr:hypothetical protein DZG01_24650 [Pseudomonas fluorescens]